MIGYNNNITYRKGVPVDADDTNRVPSARSLQSPDDTDGSSLMMMMMISLFPLVIILLVACCRGASVRRRNILRHGGGGRESLHGSLDRGRARVHIRIGIPLAFTLPV
jgi:hypothetical protein